MFLGWGVALAGCAATIVIGWNVLGALAFRGVLDLFRAPGTTRELPSSFELIGPLIPSGAAIMIIAWMLWFTAQRSDRLSPWWLFPALLVASGTFLFGVWVCVDVWPTQAGGTM